MFGTRSMKKIVDKLEDEILVLTAKIEVRKRTIEQSKRLYSKYKDPVEKHVIETCSEELTIFQAKLEAKQEALQMISPKRRD